MTADLLLGLIHVNVAGGAAILAVLLLRKPVRLMFGAHAGYWLWTAVPLAAFASLLPAPVSVGATGPSSALLEGLGRAAPSILAVWLIGAVIGAGLLAMGQWRFHKRSQAGQAGPAIFGVLFPRIVLPSDFTQRFTEQEQAVILSHERAHLARDDAQANAALALAQCLFWFNPLIHIAAWHARLDQELACDATVMARYPKARRQYAEAMLKTQLGDDSLPLGCSWAAGSIHPLEARIGMLKRKTPTVRRLRAGLLVVAVLAATAGFGAWRLQPHRAPDEPPPPFPTMVVLQVAPAAP